MMGIIRLFFGTVSQYHNLRSSIQQFARFEMRTVKETVIVITVPQAYTESGKKPDDF
jgi:hypothetical protein